MTGQEKLQEYKEALQESNKAQARVNVVENELRQMVHSFFADCRGGWYFNSMKYGENTTELCVEEVIMGEGEDYCFPVPTSIILKYLDGNTEEATKEFQKWHKGYWEQKFVHTPGQTWYSLDKEPHDYMLGKMLWVLYKDGSYDLRAVGRAYYDDGHFDWTWVEDTCYDKDSDHEPWDSVAFWTFLPKVTR